MHYITVLSISGKSAENIIIIIGIIIDIIIIIIIKTRNHSCG